MFRLTHGVARLCPPYIRYIRWKILVTRVKSFLTPSRAQQTPSGGAGVAGKPQPAAIRAQTGHRELIVPGSTRSVGRGAIVRSRGTRGLNLTHVPQGDRIAGIAQNR